MLHSGLYQRGPQPRSATVQTRAGRLGPSRYRKGAGVLSTGAKKNAHIDANLRDHNAGAPFDESRHGAQQFCGITKPLGSAVPFFSMEVIV